MSNVVVKSVSSALGCTFAKYGDRDITIELITRGGTGHYVTHEGKPYIIFSYIEERTEKHGRGYRTKCEAMVELISPSNGGELIMVIASKVDRLNIEPAKVIRFSQSGTNKFGIFALTGKGLILGRDGKTIIRSSGGFSTKLILDAANFV